MIMKNILLSLETTGNNAFYRVKEAFIETNFILLQFFKNLSEEHLLCINQFSRAKISVFRLLSRKLFTFIVDILCMEFM